TLTAHLQRQGVGARDQPVPELLLTECPQSVGEGPRARNTPLIGEVLGDGGPALPLRDDEDEFSVALTGVIRGKDVIADHEETASTDQQEKDERQRKHRAFVASAASFFGLALGLFELATTTATATVGLGDLVQAGLVVLVFLVVPVVFLDGGFFYVLPRHGFVPPVTATATDGCFLGGWDILLDGRPSGLLLGRVTATTATATSTVTFVVLARCGVWRVLPTEGRCEGVGGLIEYRRSLFRESTTVTGAGLVLTSPATAPTPPGRFLVEDLGERTGVRGATHPRKTSGVEDI